MEHLDLPDDALLHFLFRSDPVVISIRTERDRDRISPDRVIDLPAQLWTDGDCPYHPAEWVPHLCSAAHNIVTGQVRTLQFIHGSGEIPPRAYHKTDSRSARLFHRLQRLRSGLVVVSEKGSVHIACYHLDHSIYLPVFSHTPIINSFPRSCNPRCTFSP